MDDRINRFKLCDLRFYPYLKRIFERLPVEVKEIMLNDKSFQILTDDEGMGRLSNKELNLPNRKFETDLISEDIVPLKNLELVESDNGRISESLSNRMAMLAGILTAVKEVNL